MYNLHAHSLLSDGVLLPSEVARRYEEKGYKAIAITDHVDVSNIKRVISEITSFCKAWPKNRIKVLPGIELTHLPLEQFAPLIKLARRLGIKVIVGHGETVMEPVIEGTNRAALLSGIDILAHPGLITLENAKLAAKKGVFLELSSRGGHNQTNQHVAEQAFKAGAKLLINTDSHAPIDIIFPQELSKTGKDAGLTEEQIAGIYSDEQKLIKRLCAKSV